MIVTPQSHLEILRGIPWTNDYKHTRYFDTENQQNAYMSDITKRAYTFTNFTYIREQNVIRVPVCADNLYDCNYLRYMNNGFGTKWFYAFITDVKYINPETSEISFEIDEFQTWWFSADIGNSYVEREHVADDTIGKHLVDEDIGTGEIAPQVVYHRYWKYNSQGSGDFAKGMSVVIQVKPTLVGDFLGNQIPFDYLDSQIVPKTVQKSQPIDKDQLNLDLAGTTLTGADIGSAYMFPYELMTQPVGGVHLDTELVNNNIIRPSAYKMSPALYDNTDPTYTPKNNKLLTYPYTYLYVVSSDGNSAKYKWENTEAGELEFDIMGCQYNKPSASLMPSNYLYKREDRLNDVPINNFPEVSVGQYEQFKPQNIINGLLGIGGAGINWAKTGNPFGFVSNTAQYFTGLATDTPDKDFGTSGNSLLLRNGMFGYNFYVMGIYGQNAKIIDDYLTRFGYRVNCIKVPELHSRKRWNYVKCKECEFSAKNNKGVPTGTLQRLQDMFNAGITLWHINDVGNFTGDNGIRS